MISIEKPRPQGNVVLDWNSSAHPGHHTPGFVGCTLEYCYLRQTRACLQEKVPVREGREEMGSHLILGMAEGSWGEENIVSLNRDDECDGGF